MSAAHKLRMDATRLLLDAIDRLHRGRSVEAEDLAHQAIGVIQRYRVVLVVPPQDATKS